jgi:hypothetical protein
MNQVEKAGLFISHTVDEAPAAEKLKSLLRQSFGRDFDVFVSSDYRSISGGDNWFETIIGKLKGVRVVIVLLSHYSIERRWINFEAGVGIGADAQIIPLVFRNLKKSEVGLPLGLLQVRDSSDIRDLRGLIGDISSKTGVEPKSVDIELFIDEFHETVNRLPTKDLKMIPYITRNGLDMYLNFRLENAGTEDIELIEVWAKIPESIRNTSSILPYGSSALKVDYNYNPNTIKLRQFAGREISGPDYRTDFEMLPSVITESMFPVRLKELRFSLKNFSGIESIEFGFHGKRIKGLSEVQKLKDIEGF